MKKRDRKLFAVADIFIILFAVVISVVALVSQLNSKTDELSCVVRVGGEVVRRVPLSQVNEKECFEVEGEFPVTVVMTNTSVYVESASCPDKLCEHTGEIKRASQSIVCLPAKVSVTLDSSNSDLDAVVG
ncbi:MAG: NusG domain II-containing protein [Ruminococcus sp.]|nr:NusG domain II-containing protein [Ruminococcus sp.]MBQ7133448.1 NusG domain II-containing protein [Ruminococcus sp.]